MKLPIYQVDAFTSRVFAGNPAAVCPLPSWLDDVTLQAVAAENNLSETAFFVGGDGEYDLRWFTPAQEVDLCGHATLASGHVIFDILDPARRTVTFRSKSGPLGVEREEDLLVLDFPSRPGEPVDASDLLVRALGRSPREVYRARDLMAVYDTEQDVRGLRPDFGQLLQLDALGVIVTAVGKDCDFVSRFFAPRAGIPEDPVTGSAHCTLVPYWSRRLDRSRLRARQVSSRGGELVCEDRGDRVRIGGRAVTYLEGTIRV